MPIDYTKRPKPEQSGPVVLTKAAPAVSLTKGAAPGGRLRVNLNWTARPAERGGFFKRAEPPLDLDLGCLYEFTDGGKGVVQALGNSFRATPAGMGQPVIWLDGDDRSGSNAAGENLFVDLAHVDKIARVLVFALIYEGAANWGAANGVATLYPAHGPEVRIDLDDPRDGARICAIAMLTREGNDLTVRREVNYVNGGQRLLDETYGWGMRWTLGRK